jgi:hypothetical protein
MLLCQLEGKNFGFSYLSSSASVAGVTVFQIPAQQQAVIVGRNSC